MKLLKKIWWLFLLLIAIGVTGVVVYLSSENAKSYEEALSERDSQISELSSEISSIGEMTTAYLVNTYVRAGETIQEEQLTEVTVPVNLGLDLVYPGYDFTNKYYRISMNDGCLLTYNNISETEIVDSERWYDMILDVYPIGIDAGDYIDVRIKFPYGEDLIAIPSLYVYEINNNFLKVRMNEYQINVYNSMILDSLLYGAQTYALEYIDAGSQDVAEAFYPINTSLNELLKENPNALELATQEMVLKRQSVEEMLGGGISEQTEEDLDELEDAIEEFRDNVADRVASANEVIQERREAEAEAAAEESTTEDAGW